MAIQFSSGAVLDKSIENVKNIIAGAKKKVDESFCIHSKSDDKILNI